MAIVSLVALLAALGLAVLISLQPWATDSLAPSLTVSPGLDVGVGESVEVAPARTPGIARARVAGGTSSTSVAEPVAVSKPSEGDSHPLLAVSQGRALGSSRPAPAPSTPSVPPPATPPPTQPVAAPEPSPATPAATPPLLAGVEGGTPGSSGTTSSVGEVDHTQNCEGDEYVVTIALDDGETASGLSPVHVLIRRLGSDGSESELQLEGDLDDVRDLVSLLASEGSCVQVEVVSFGKDEGAQEAPEVGTDPAESGDALESALP